MQRAAEEDSEELIVAASSWSVIKYRAVCWNFSGFPSAVLRASLLSAFNLTVSTIVLSSSYPSAWPSAKQNTRRSLAGRVFANCIVVS